MAVPSKRLTPYLVAAAAVAVASLINVIYRPEAVSVDAHYFALVAAVFASALYGGLGPGVLATLLATLSSAYLSLAPLYSLKIESSTATGRLALFFVEGLIISLICHVLRTADAVDILPSRHNRYLAMLMPVTGAILIKTVLAPDLAQQFPFSFNYAAVCVTAWLGGLTAGVAATIVLAAITRYFFLPPIHSFAISESDTIRMALFVSEGLLLALLNARHAKLRQLAQSLSTHAWRNLLAAQSSADDARAVRAISRDTIWEWELGSNKIVRTPSWRDALSSALPEQENFDAWMSRIHPQDRAKTISTLWEALGKYGEECEYGYRLLKPNGEYVAVSDHAFIVRDTQWKALRVIGRSAQLLAGGDQIQPLEKDGIHFARMFDQSPIAILIVDTGFRILFSNPAARAMLRVRASSLARTDFRLLLESESQSAVAEQMSLLFRWKRLSVHFAPIMVQRMGQTFPVRLSASLVAEFRSGATGSLVLLDEIT